MQISTYAEQWRYLDQLYKSRARQLLRFLKLWLVKPSFATCAEITGAMADFYGLLAQLGLLLDPQEGCSMKDWFS